ncbi:MAG: sn-glycerol-3-phosphate ABC transporter ATP-binding protein UgpC [Pseudomonadota bacterium]
MAEVVLEAIEKVYPNGFQAVQPSSFTIQDGEFMVLVGPSGCGKSTILRMIAGLEEVSKGSISIGDKVVNDVDPADRNIAMVFQNYALYPHMTVERNMGYGLKNRGIPKAEIAEKVREAAAMLNLTDYLDRRPSQLSGGQRQRVAMGRAIVRQPDLFLFDEPLSNLDAKLRNQMRIEVKSLQRRLATTAVYVTHDQVEAMTMADRIIVLNGGVIEQIGTPAEIYGRPASTFVASFMGAPPMNLLDARADDDAIFVNGSDNAICNANGSSGEVIFGVRPEDVTLGAGELLLDIEIIEELGANRLLHGRLGGQSFAVSVPKDMPAALGPTSISIKPESTHLFNRAGARI